MLTRKGYAQEWKDGTLAARTAWSGLNFISSVWCSAPIEGRSPAATARASNQSDWSWELVALIITRLLGVSFAANSSISRRLRHAESASQSVMSTGDTWGKQLHSRTCVEKRVWIQFLKSKTFERSTFKAVNRYDVDESGFVLASSALGRISPVCEGLLTTCHFESAPEQISSDWIRRMQSRWTNVTRSFNCMQRLEYPSMFYYES